MADLRQTTHFKNQSVKGMAVHKDECAKCFKDTFDPEGVNLCLQTLASYCQEHLPDYVKKTGRHHFLNIKQTKKMNAEQAPDKEKITKLAIGMEGGIDASKRFEVETSHQFKYLGQGENPIKESEVAGLIKSVLESDSASKKNELEAWEAQIFPCEHTLTLNQDQAKQIASKSLAHCGLCDLDNNLWICLECGHLACGRKNYDGSGGNGHALAHFESSGHSLVVKSGTISAEGDASVFCYSCDNNVKDENLPTHLAKLGIKVNEMKKTEKTMAELELEANLNLTLSKTWEQGKLLVPVFGAKKTGLENIGNSCYLASVVQCLANIPEIEKRYHTLAAQHMDSCTVSPQDCITCQACKLFSGLISGNYSIKKTDEIEIPSTGEKTISHYQEGIKPRMFRQLLGKGHQEFSTSKQQDAMEYLIHLLSNLTRVEQAGQLSPITNLFEFEMEIRAKCPNCPAVQVTEATSKFLNLPVPLPENFETYGDSGKQEDLDYSAPLSSCLNLFIHGDKEVRYTCQNCKKEGLFKKTKYLKTFPKYLLVQITNFALNGWAPKKLHCDVQFGDLENVILTTLKAPALPSDAIVIKPENEDDGPQVDELALTQLMTMGFSENRCKRALMDTGNDVDNALNTIMSSLDDLSLDAPIQPKKKAHKMDEGDSISKLVEQVWPTAESMGLSKDLVYAAAEIKSNPDEIVAYIFDHQEELYEKIEQKKHSAVHIFDSSNHSNSQSATHTNYEAIGAVIHLGRSVHVGHYVAYTKQEDGWIYFNDNKVAKSDHPAVGKSYICFFKRKD